MVEQAPYTPKSGPIARHPLRKKLCAKLQLDPGHNCHDPVESTHFDSTNMSRDDVVL